MTQTPETAKMRRKTAKRSGRGTVLFVGLALVAAAILAVAALVGGPREEHPEDAPQAVASAVELAVPGAVPEGVLSAATAAAPAAAPPQASSADALALTPKERPAGAPRVAATSPSDEAAGEASGVPEESVGQVEAEGVALAAMAPAAGPGAGAVRAAPVDANPSLPWRAYAGAVPAAAKDRPAIALVIDDLGHNATDVARAIALDPAVTLAFLPYTGDVERSAWLARRAGREVLVHLPMEPESGDSDPGPHAMKTAMGHDEMLRTLYWNLARFDQYVGVNNHMGSKFSEDRAGMEIVLEEIKRRGLLYLDSVTTPSSAAPALAAALGVPFAGRDVFLDNELDAGSIDKQLATLEEIARRKGYAIAIAHPHPETFKALEAWLPTLEAKGFALVPVSAIVLKNAEKIRALASAAKP